MNKKEMKKLKKELDEMRQRTQAITKAKPGLLGDWSWQQQKAWNPYLKKAEADLKKAEAELVQDGLPHKPDDVLAYLQAQSEAASAKELADLIARKKAADERFPPHPPAQEKSE